MKTAMKVFAGLFVLLLLLVGGGLYYVYTNLDALVERGIETAGTSAAGTAVQVDGVELDLVGGSAIVRGFTLANPAGYSEGSMLSVEELAVVIDVANMDRNNIRIVSVTGRNPHLLYETHDGKSNVDVLREQLAPAGAPAEQDTGPGLNLEIGSIVIESIGATVSSDLMPQPAEVDLGDVRLENLRGTPDEIAQQVMRPLLTQLAANAGRIALTLIPEDFRAAGAAVRDAAGARIEQAGDAVGTATQNLREGLGGLLGGDEEEEADEEQGDAGTANQ